jgi:FkbM family methyltransferase
MMIDRIMRRLKKWYYSPNLERELTKAPPRVTRLGTSYGGWNFSPSLLQDGQWAMLCGAGEDVSFDLELQRETGMDVVIVDPTPRAIAHWDHVIAASESGSGLTDKVSGNPYNLTGIDFSKITYMPYAIWNEPKTIKFWEPANPKHVSYSATNLQSTNAFIEVSALDPSELAKRTGRSLETLGLLKLDIEGAEGAIIDWFLGNRILVPQLLVEFDEMTRPSRESRDSVRRMVNQLLSAGYELVLKDGPANALFVRR